MPLKSQEGLLQQSTGDKQRTFLLDSHKWRLSHLRCSLSAYRRLGRSWCDLHAHCFPWILLQGEMPAKRSRPTSSFHRRDCLRQASVSGYKIWEDLGPTRRGWPWEQGRISKKYRYHLTFQKELAVISRHHFFATSKNVHVWTNLRQWQIVFFQPCHWYYISRAHYQWTPGFWPPVE